MKTAACLVAAFLSVAAGPVRARALFHSEGGLEGPAPQQPPEARTAALTRQLRAAIRALALRPEGGAANEDELVHELGASMGALERNEGAPREGESPPEEPLVRGMTEAVAASLLRSEGGSPTVMEQMKALVDSMQESILLDHNRSQDLVSKIAGNFSVCTADTAWAGYKNTYELKLPQHATCRADELQLNSTYTSCEAEKAAHCEIKKVKCDDFKSEEIKPNDPVVECGLSLPREQYIARIAQKFESLNATFQEKKQTCRVVSVPCDTKVCDLLGLQTKRQECDTLLREVQAAACGWATAKKITCNQFDDCWRGATDGYAELKAEHASQQEQRKLSWRIMERLECFIEADAAADKNAEIEKCLKAPRPDTSHLNISFPSLPPNPGCQDPVIYPCSHPYLAAIRVSGIDLPACQVCSLPSPGPSPPPPSPSPSPPGPPPPGPEVGGLGDSLVAVKALAFHVLDIQGGHKVWGYAHDHGIVNFGARNILKPTLFESLMPGAADDPPIKLLPVGSGNAWLTQSGKVMFTGELNVETGKDGKKCNPCYSPTELLPSFFAGKPPVVRISGGGEYTFTMMAILLKDGSVYESGTVESGPSPPRIPPTKVTGLPDGDPVVEVSVFHGRSGVFLALTQSGKVYTWGWGPCLGRSGPERPAGRVEGLPGNDPVKKITNGGGQCWAMTRSGRLYSWGRNDQGNLGRSPSSDVVMSVAETTLPSGEQPVHVAAKWTNYGVGTGGTTFVVTASGKLLTIGLNSRYELGDGTKANRASWGSVLNLPADDPVVCAWVFSQNAFARTKSGKLFGWGGDTWPFAGLAPPGLLAGVGDGTEQHRPLPVLLPDVVLPAV